MNYRNKDLPTEQRTKKNSAVSHITTSIRHVEGGNKVSQIIHFKGYSSPHPFEPSFVKMKRKRGKAHKPTSSADGTFITTETGAKRTATYTPRLIHLGIRVKGTHFGVKRIKQ